MIETKLKSSTPVSEVQNFWNENPCGEKFQKQKLGSAEFFKSVEKHRYELESHILDLIPFKDYRDKNVLEIGCGLGTDAVQFARNGAHYFGVDLTPNAIKLTRERFAQENLKGEINQANAEKLPFQDNFFDCVYSHGVIHHIPDIQKVVSEIHRVLKPGGKAIVMVYHKSSINYWIQISLLRRMGIWLLAFPGGVSLVHAITKESKKYLEQHKRNLKRFGLKYLSSQEFLNQNTDGPGNPLSRVFTSKTFKKLFSQFSNSETHVRYFNKHRIPILRAFLPKWVENQIASRWGWHLYIFAQK